MAQPSPTIEGFRAAFRRPGTVVGEITWRWVFGAATLALLTLSFFEFLDTLRVSKADLFFLRSNQPFLVSQALSHIFHGSSYRVIISLLIMTTALAMFWVLAASVGRAATLESLLDYFAPGNTRDLGAMSDRAVTPSTKGRFGSLVGLNFLRVALALAAILAVIAAGVIAGFASSDKNPQPGLVFLIFLPFAALVGLLWSSLNWFLTVAPIFVVGDRCDTFEAIGATVDFCRQRKGPIFWSSTAFGIIHLIFFVGASSVVAFPFAFIGVLPGAVVFGAIALLTLVYFAVVDFFFTGRMAAYIAILQTPVPVIAPVPILPTRVSEPTVATPLTPTPWEALSDDIVSDTHPGAAKATDSTSLPGARWAASEDDILSDIPGLSPPRDDEKER